MTPLEVEIHKDHNCWKIRKGPVALSFRGPDGNEIFLAFNTGPLKSAIGRPPDGQRPSLGDFPAGWDIVSELREGDSYEIPGVIRFKHTRK